MKNIINYMKAVLACLFVSLAFVACSDDDDLGSADLGLGIKVFAPTHVVAGQPMTINGSGFDNLAEIEFPGGVKVSTFEPVTNEMIRVVAPAGMPAEGGKIILHGKDGGSVESRLPLTIGKTVVNGFSLQEGEKVTGYDEITIYGEDLLFVNEIVLLDENEEPLPVPQTDFSRLAPNRLVLKVPNNIFTGVFAGTIKTFDGQSFKMPEYEYEPKKNQEGHWEITKSYLWKNGEHSTIPAPSWSGEGRFASASHSSGEETYAFSEEEWEFLKTQPFRIEIEKLADWVNLRVTTGWWSTNYKGLESLNDLVQEDEDGSFFVELNLQDDPALLALLDEQHLLFTGQDYKLLGIYFLEKKWVGGEGHMEIVRTTFWKNGEHSTIPAPSWSGEGRFASASHSTGEETYAFSEEEWEILKTQPFRIAIEKNADWVNLRVTTGWWSTNYMGMESLNDLVQQNEDGSYYVEIDLSKDPALLALLDEQHLLFTGQDYKLLEIYQEQEVWVGGDGAKENILWEGEALADNWGNQPFILSDGGAELSDANAKEGQILRFFITPTEDNWNLQIVEGHWGGTYVDYNQDNWDLKAHGGSVDLELTADILQKALTQQWWGGAFLLNGDNVICTKVTLE